MAIAIDRSKLQEKRRDMRKRDTAQGVRQPGCIMLRTAEILQMIQDNGPVCKGCNCTLLFNGYKKWCLFQYTLDRIDTTKAHTIDNIRVRCFACNSARRDGIQKWACSSGCHGQFTSRFRLCPSGRELVSLVIYTLSLLQLKHLFRCCTCRMLCFFESMRRKVALSSAGVSSTFKNSMRR